MKQMKTYTLSQIKDEMIGKEGAPSRDKYESKIYIDLSQKSAKTLAWKTERNNKQQ